jgi:hypothetical protein
MCGSNYRIGSRASIGFMLFFGLIPTFCQAADDLSSGAPTSIRSDSPKAIVAPRPEYLSTMDCAPCSFMIGQALPSYLVRFKVRDLPDKRRGVEELRISSDAKPGWEQSLSVHEMTPVTRNKEFSIGTADINFDGYNDLFFVTSRGVANTYADYWLFTPSEGSFSYLGNYPMFTIDRVKHSLSSYERGGHGGMIYTANSYSFIEGVLTLVDSEKQEATDRDGVYLKKMFKLKAGKLRLVKTEKVRSPLTK